MGYVFVQDVRFGEAVMPLVEALVAAQELPQYAQGIVGTIVDLLRGCHQQGPDEVGRMFRTVTGQDIPDWMKEPPSES